MALEGSQATAAAERRAGLGWRVARAFVQRREASILVIAAGLFAYFGLSYSAFPTHDAIQTMGDFAAPVALITAGEVMLLICGEIDLAVGRVFALSPIIMYLASAPAPDGAGLPIWIGALFGLLTALAVGLVNGFITTVLRVPAFITTLGMLFFLNGINLKATNSFQVLTPGTHAFNVVTGEYVPHLLFNAEFYWAVGAVIVVQFILTRTRWGLHTIATGGNPVGAAEAGVDIRMIKIGNFMLANLLAGFAGILDSVRITSILPLQGGPDIMFQAVAAAVIGGTALLGGAGTVVGGFIGVAVLAILNIGFTIAGVSALYFDLIIGLAILASMIANVQVARLKNLGRLQ
ncbi:MAG TPA: ABC transporter permease [Gaiellaceae bacterium]|nr:ABC transporter permease [Gaiellaceae bacterium]